MSSVLMKNMSQSNVSKVNYSVLNTIFDLRAHKEKETATCLLDYRMMWSETL
jgi:hypothetical protein